MFHHGDPDEYSGSSTLFASFALDVAPSALGGLRRSDDIAGDERALRQRFAEDGDLYLPGYLDREEVLAARRAITDRLAAAGWLMAAFRRTRRLPRPLPRARRWQSARAGAAIAGHPATVVCRQDDHILHGLLGGPLPSL